MIYIMIHMYDPTQVLSYELLLYFAFMNGVTHDRHNIRTTKTTEATRPPDYCAFRNDFQRQARIKSGRHRREKRGRG